MLRNVYTINIHLISIPWIWFRYKVIGRDALNGIAAIARCMLICYIKCHLLLTHWLIKISLFHFNFKREREYVVLRWGELGDSIGRLFVWNFLNELSLGERRVSSLSQTATNRMLELAISKAMEFSNDFQTDLKWNNWYFYLSPLILTMIWLVD